MELKSHIETPEASGDPNADLWAELARAGDASAFCQAWLNIQCAAAPGARSGIVLMECEDRSFAPAAIWPAGPCDVTPLKEVAEEALTTGRAAMRGAPDEPGRTHVAYPVTAGDHICGVVVLDLDGRSAGALQDVLRNIHWGVGWIASMGWRHRSEDDRKKLQRGAAAVDLLAVAQEHPDLDSAAMAIANELAAQVRVDKVSIGRLVKGDIRTLAMSHGAWFRKRSEALDIVEAAMEEALDQKSSIVFPAASGPTRITLAHARLAASSQAQHIASVLVTERGETTGVITFERKEGPAFSADEILMCEAMAAMVGPAIEMRAREQRWVSGRIRSESRKFLEALVGKRRPVVKVVTGSLLLFLLLLLLPTGFRISANSALEGSVQRAAAAPFAGFIAGSSARPGSVVKQGAVLATLDDRDLKLDRLRWASERDRLDQRYRAALATHDRAEMSLVGAQLRQAEAQLSLTDYKLARTKILAPISGIIVSGDLSQLIGAPVEEGKLLFEIAPLEGYRVALKVEEKDIRYVRVGQKGAFAPTGLSGGTIPIVVTRLTSVATADEGNNFFRIEARVDGTPPHALRPGMEGVAKVTVGEESRLWIWTRGMRDWLRLFAWKWLP